MDPRRVLWRDSASILVVMVIALLGIQTFLPGTNGPPSDSSIPSPIILRSLPPGVTLAPGETLGPIIDPSLGVDATPTPIPVITLGPPTPSPSPSPAPSGSPKPSAKPSAKPSTGPSVPPSVPPSAPPTPTPSGNPVVSCDLPIGQTVTCNSAASTNIQAGSEVWDMGGAGTFDIGGPGFASVTWTYSSPGPFTATVTLTVTGLDGGTPSNTTTVDIPAP